MSGSGTQKRRGVRSAGLGVLAVLVLGLLALALAGCQSDSSTGEGGATMVQPVDTITVSGTGTASVMPDEAVVTVAVENDADDAATALDQNSKQMQKVIDALKAAGIKEEQIETASVVVYPNRRYDPQTGEESLVGFRASNSVTVTMTDMTQVPLVYKAAGEAGATNLSGPVWTLSDDNQGANQALTLAAENALSKAQALAAAAGVKVGEVMILNEGTTTTPPIMYEAKGEAMAAGDSVTPPPVTPGKIDVTATVTVTYRLER